MNKKSIAYIIATVVAFTVFAGSTFGYMYFSTPHHIRYPAFEHYHARAQIIVDGQPVNFAAKEFQKEYDKSSCSAELSGEPFDFHDDMDQMVHVHWDGMTGGEFLKFYGWSLNDAKGDSLGRRFDNGLMKMHEVKTKGNLLPALPNNSNFYVFIGDENGYEQKSWEDFLKMDMEEFFGKKSNLSQDEQVSLLHRLFLPKAYAHGGTIDGDDDEGSTKTEEELTRINNLVGNVVIFVQQNQPTKEQIQERFNNLVPLHESTCGG